MDDDGDLLNDARISQSDKLIDDFKHKKMQMIATAVFSSPPANNFKLPDVSFLHDHSLGLVVITNKRPGFEEKIPDRKSVV